MRQKIGEAFERQATDCERMGSPFNALLCRLLARRLDSASSFGRRIDEWPGPPVSDALALRACGALHGLARSGRAPRLAAQYPPHVSVGDDARLWVAIAEALEQHDAFLCDYLDGPPQTNEVGRSSALLGAALLLTERTGLPLGWHEIGASAGLNLGFDQYCYELGSARHGDPAGPVHVRSEWQGELPPLSAPLRVLARTGADLNPLDPSSEFERERLLSYVWPDQSERMARTQAALDVAAGAAWNVRRMPASQAVAEHFSGPLQEGRVHVLVHTIVWQYLPETEREAITSRMHEAGRRATRQAPVAWLGMEADGAPDGAGVHLSLWPSGERELIARADFHGRWVRWL
jgi:hypothetical protein